MASNGRGTDSLGNFALILAFNRPNNKEGYPIMGKKLMVIALAVFAFGLPSALRSNAGTEMIEPYSAPASTYNYTQPPAAMYYAPPSSLGIVVRPASVYYRPRVVVYGARRYDWRPWRSHHHWR